MATAAQHPATMSYHGRTYTAIDAPGPRARGAVKSKVWDQGQAYGLENTTGTGSDNIVIDLWRCSIYKTVVKLFGSAISNASKHMQKQHKRVTIDITEGLTEDPASGEVLEETSIVTSVTVRPRQSQLRFPGNVSKY